MGGSYLCGAGGDFNGHCVAVFVVARVLEDFGGEMRGSAGKWTEKAGGSKELVIRRSWLVDWACRGRVFKSC